MPDLRVRARLEWVVTDVDALEMRLRHLGFDVGPGFRLSFPSLEVRLTRSGGHVADRRPGRGEPPGDLLVAVDPALAPAGGASGRAGACGRRAPSTGPHPNGVVDCVGIGWATVDRDRAASAATGIRFTAALSDPHIGAHVLVAGGVPATILLEPNTEGRLAGTLARHGECLAVLYLMAGPSGLSAVIGAVRRAGGATTATRIGPLGPSVLILGGSPWGPHLVVVERASTDLPAGNRSGGGEPNRAAPGTIEP
jgi:hypothetical protein